MSDISTSLITTQARGEWVRMRTLIMLRWIAITGQIIAISVAGSVFRVQLDLGLCYLAVGAAIVANLFSIFVFPENRRLSPTEAMFTQMFDIAQITFLLYVTGGLNNPFTLLLMAPVTISATALEARYTIGLGVLTVVLITFLAFFSRPLVLADGSVLQLPDIYLLGFWSAIVIGIGFLGAYAHRVSAETHSMADALAATQMALAREQKLTDLGGVVAAAAHELGTPLATIKLVSSEMMEQLEHDPDLRDDAELIRSQADRCRDILRSMGQAGKDDLHMRTAPLDTVIREAAEPHVDRGKTIHFEVAPGPDGDARQPSVFRRPEVIHGLRNLIQNAVDFSAANVWVSAHWTPVAVSVRIIDDGSGFPPQLIGRIGDPFMRHRHTADERARRPEYEGMGLGLFIAKTLLERSGAELVFANASDPYVSPQERPEKCGAIVEVVWPRRMIADDATGARAALGPNQPIPV